MRLYIIGNGFDLAHGLKTTYFDFAEYLKKESPGFFNYLNNIYNEDELWSNFEEALGKLNIEKVNYIENIIGIKDFNSLFLPKEIKEELCKWLNSIDYNATKKFKIEKNDIYFSFNYTDTLNKVYNIDIENIEYIHCISAYLLFGAADELIIGHNNSDFNQSSLLKNTYKNTKENIKKHKEWFNKLNKIDISEIIIIGFSYSSIDFEYFKKISELLPNANWKFTYYNDNDKNNAKIYIEKMKERKNFMKMLQVTYGYKERSYHLLFDENKFHFEKGKNIG